MLGVCQLPDHPVDRLAAMSGSKKVVPATFEVAFIPGLSAEPDPAIGPLWRLSPARPGPRLAIDVTQLRPLEITHP